MSLLYHKIYKKTRKKEGIYPLFYIIYGLISVLPFGSFGTVPFDAPILDKPEINIEDIPLLPPAPILDKPELIIDLPDPKRDEPKPEPKQDKPSTPAPKTETKKETVEVVNQVETKQDEPVKAYNAPAVLPATGTDLGLSLVALGISVATLAFTLKKKEN